MIDEDLFRTNLTVMGELFAREVSPALAKIYWNALCGYSDDEVRGATAKAIETLRFFPKPAELIEFIVGGKMDAERAYETWAVVMKELRDAENADFRSKATQRAIDIMGGAVYLSRLSHRELEFKKKEFIEIYDFERPDKTGIEHDRERIGKEGDH